MLFIAPAKKRTLSIPATEPRRLKMEKKVQPVPSFLPTSAHSTFCLRLLVDASVRDVNTSKYSSWMFEGGEKKKKKKGSGQRKPQVE